MRKELEALNTRRELEEDEKTKLVEQYEIAGRDLREANAALLKRVE